MSVRLPLAAALFAALGTAALGRPAASPVRPAACARSQVFDGISTVLTCAAGAAEGRRLDARTGAQSAMSGPALRLLGLKVDVNQAGVEDLEALPGVGPKIAERIVAARPFCRPDDLRDVPGIGPKRFVELEDKVTVGSEGRRFCADHL